MRLLTVGLWIGLNYCILQCYSLCTSDYGSNTCTPTYLPAPPGKTPSCARPGYTFCEHPDHYPSELIYLLIQRWQFDHKSLIISEVQEDFNSYFYPRPSTVYGPPSTIPNFVQNNQDDGYHYPDPVNPFKPTHIFPGQGGYHIPPNTYNVFNHSYPSTTLGAGQTDSTNNYNKDDTFYTYKYTSGLPHHQPTPKRPYDNPYQSTDSYFTPQTYSHINGIWKRSQRLKRSLRIKRISKQLLPFEKEQAKFHNNTLQNNSRKKRQSTITGQPLCRSTSRYITPRAALNSKGNWMYVVNMPEANQQYTQLVKSEVCADTNCNGLCQLPQGYSSRCEQKYVQKRLIALEGNGSDLYSDVFWFPSCCACTISNS